MCSVQFSCVPVFCIGAIVKPNWNKVCKKSTRYLTLLVFSGHPASRWQIFTEHLWFENIKKSKIVFCSRFSAFIYWHLMKFVLVLLRNGFIGLLVLLIDLIFLDLTYIYMSWNLRTGIQDLSLHKKWSFPLRISSVNVTKSAVSCGFGQIYWRNP